MNPVHDTAARPNESEVPPTVVGLGEILWDLLPTGPQLGGAPANFAFHAAQLGARGIPASHVGDDPLGRNLFARLADLALDPRFVSVDPVHPTGTVSVRLDAHGSAQYTIHENVAWDHIPFTLPLQSLVAQADALCVGSLAQRHPDSRATIQRCLAATRPDCLRIFDLNLRQHYYDRDTLESTLQVCRLFKLNDEEWPVLAALLGLDAERPAGLRALFRRYASLQWVALTAGPRGSTLYTPTECDVLAGQAVRVVDTVGAGDAFTGVLAVGLLAGLPLPGVHRHAAQVAAYVCTQQGATPLLPRELRSMPRL